MLPTVISIAKTPAQKATLRWQKPLMKVTKYSSYISIPET
jgi:hypothetical protein